VQVRPSRTGKYVAVSVFVTVTSFEQVKATYDLMKADKRLRYFI
jgi:putative lipoic acid-binding regulatory protein